MRVNLSTKVHYSSDRRKKSTIKFQTKMNVNKRMNTSQQQAGVDGTPFLLGIIQYGKLKTIHIPLVIDEILLRTQQAVDPSIGIRKLTAIIREDEKRITKQDLKYFKPKSKPGEDWKID